MFHWQVIHGACGKSVRVLMSVGISHCSVYMSVEVVVYISHPYDNEDKCRQPSV